MSKLFSGQLSTNYPSTVHELPIFLSLSKSFCAIRGIIPFDKQAHPTIRSFALKQKTLESSRSFRKKNVYSSRTTEEAKVCVAINSLLNKFSNFFISLEVGPELSFHPPWTGDPEYLFSDGLTKRNISIRLRTKLIFIPINYLRLLARHPKSISEFSRLEKGSRWFARLCETKWKRKAFPFNEAICRRERSNMWKLQLFALFVWLISSPYARRFIRDYTHPYPSLAMSSTSKRDGWLFSIRPSLHSRISSEADDQCKWILPPLIKRTEKLSFRVWDERNVSWIIHVNSWETVNEKLFASYYGIGEAQFTSIKTCEGGTDSYRQWSILSTPPSVVITQRVAVISNLPNRSLSMLMQI